jgi:type III restriction enzyme
MGWERKWVRLVKLSGVMDNQFFERPILNSPYDDPRRHWELDEQGQPTQLIIETRRRAEFISPIPKPKKRKAKPDQQQIRWAAHSSLAMRGSMRPR